MDAREGEQKVRGGYLYRGLHNVFGSARRKVLTKWTRGGESVDKIGFGDGKKWGVTKKKIVYNFGQ